MSVGQSVVIPFICRAKPVSSCITEGWLEIDKHYSLELCFSIEYGM